MEGGPNFGIHPPNRKPVGTALATRRVLYVILKHSYSFIKHKTLRKAIEIIFLESKSFLLAS